jgi:alpha-beta hydrolase superfamily lysophospholipase
MEQTGWLDNGRLFYRSWPAAAARANVVLAHGYAEHSGRYEHVGQLLSANGLSAWAVDHRGHGRSGGERGDIVSIDATVDDLHLLVSRVVAAAGGPVFVVGHSMGGAIATAYAEQHQADLAGLALSAPALLVPPELLALADLDEIPDLGLANAVSSDPAVVRAYLDDPLTVLGAPPRNFFRAMGAVDEVRSQMSVVELPVLVMQGSGDLLVSPRALVEVVAGVSSADLVARLWPGLFHEIFNEPQRDQVLAVLVSWIEDHLAG